jgi:hypothetical protein
VRTIGTVSILLLLSACAPRVADVENGLGGADKKIEQLEASTVGSENRRPDLIPGSAID